MNVVFYPDADMEPAPPEAAEALFGSPTAHLLRGWVHFEDRDGNLALLRDARATLLFHMDKHAT